MNAATETSESFVAPAAAPVGTGIEEEESSPPRRMKQNRGIA